MDTQTKIQELEARISKLESLEYSVTESIKDRFFENTGASSTQVIGTAGLSATVPAQPTGTLTLVYKGKRYKLLYE